MGRATTRGDPGRAGPAIIATPDAATERSDRVGARLALAGFLMAGFFILRTYVPVLYLLISLPLRAADRVPRRRRRLFAHAPAAVADVWTIGALCLSSIAVIAAIAYVLKG